MYISIIGTNHEHQYCRLGKNSLNFASLLKSVLTNSQFDLVAEELNKDSIDQENALGSVAKNVADELAISHLFVDPGVIERKELGIVGFKQIVKEVCGGSIVKPELREEVEKRDKAEWDIRERVWIDKIEKSGRKTILFICGFNHVDRFTVLLTAHGIQSGVFERDWQP
jgi:hypothetical protein